MLINISLVKIIITLLFVLSLLSCKEKKMYTNPVSNITNIGDPFVMTHNGMYYLYATSFENGFFVWTSTDLVNWEKQGLALSKDTEGIFGIDRFWAPEVVEYKDKFYMTYSAGGEDHVMKICLAVSETPLGPFTPYATPWFNHPISHIDANIFIDQDGTPYTYFVRDCSNNMINGRGTSQIFMSQLSVDLKEFVTDPQLVLEPSQKWEHRSNRPRIWNEGPFVLERDGMYYMTYSANVYDSKFYAVGYATSRSPRGPWIKAEENPILEANMDIGVSGPGHNSFALSPDGEELFMVYHAHTFPEEPSGNRAVYIDRVRFVNGKMVVDGPTKTPQNFPSN